VLFRSVVPPPERPPHSNRNSLPALSPSLVCRTRVVTTSRQICAQVLLHRSCTPYLTNSLERASAIPRAISKATELGLVGTGSRVLLLTGRDDMIANRLETFVVGEGVISSPPPPPPPSSGDEWES